MGGWSFSFSSCFRFTARSFQRQGIFSVQIFPVRSLFSYPETMRAVFAFVLFLLVAVVQAKGEEETFFFS